MQDFLAALNRPGKDSRLDYFRTLLPAQERVKYLESQYARAMDFLYRKEFAAAGAGSAGKGRYLAALYEERGYSSDTQVEANFAVWTALSVLKTLHPSLRLNRVLIVGPGLDFAPRTALLDTVEPQSYQPFAAADALLGLGLADRHRLQIHCVDINDRVIAYLQGFAKRKRRVLILASPARDPEYQEYFAALGKSIGAVAGLPPDGAYHRKSLDVGEGIARTITAEKLNIVTERYDPSPGYDLVIATNVLVYCKPVELLLALANIRSMLAGGGYLIHNEFRPEMETFTRLLGLESIEARTLRLSAGGSAPLVDGFVIHRKAVAPGAGTPR
jgi:hypothetical protein